MSSKGWDTGDPSDPAALPEWAVAKARASLQLGMKVPEVQLHLVARGLSRATAEAVVTRLLEGHVRAEAAALENRTPKQPVEQLLAVGVTLVCIVVGLVAGGASEALIAAFWAVFPLWRIWVATGWTRWLAWSMLVFSCLVELVRLIAIY
jgi:hypothetical protein